MNVMKDISFVYYMEFRNFRLTYYKNVLATLYNDGL